VAYKLVHFEIILFASHFLHGLHESGSLKDVACPLLGTVGFSSLFNVDHQLAS
jgi:hypothetical protein